MIKKENLIEILENEWKFFFHVYGKNASIEWFIQWLTARFGYSFIIELKESDLI